MKKIAVSVNPDILDLLSKYVSKKKALRIAKEFMSIEYGIRQDMKDTIIRELKLVAEPQFTFPGYERLPANTIALINDKYDFTDVLNKNNEIEFIDIPKEYI